MRTADLYAGLDWGAFELLVPQEDISDAKLGMTESSPSISIDEAVERAFGRGMQSAPVAGDEMWSFLVIKGKHYRTALMPQVVRFSGEEEGLRPCRILARSFDRHGLRPLAFAGNKIRYIVDMEKFTAGEKI